MFEVPEKPERLAIKIFQNEEEIIAECRYDIEPFFQHKGMTHVVESTLLD